MLLKWYIQVGCCYCCEICRV